MSELMLETIWYNKHHRFVYYADTAITYGDIQVKACVEYEDWQCIRDTILDDYGSKPTLDEVKKVVAGYYYQDYLEGQRSEHADAIREKNMINDYIKKGGQQ